MRGLIKALPLIVNTLAEDREIKKYLNAGRKVPLDDVKSQIGYNHRLDSSEENEETAAQVFLDVDYSVVTNQTTSSAAILTVTIAVNNALPLVDGIPLRFWLLERVIKVITSHKFGLPNKPKFNAADSAYYDSDRQILGYLVTFTLEDGLDYDKL